MNRLLIAFLLAASFASAQDLKYLRYDADLLSSGFHKNRREEVRKRLPENSAAVLFAAPVRNRANDNDFLYHQLPNFYYLTGLTEPDAMLIITKNEIVVDGKKSNEFLFVQRRNPFKETWTGRRLGIEGAQQLLGFNAVFISGEFKDTDIDFRKFSSVLVLQEPAGVVHDGLDQDDLWKLMEDFKSKVSIATLPDVQGKTMALDSFQLNDILEDLREIKQPEELTLMRKAIGVSCDAHIEMMRTAKPGMYEYEVQAVGEYVFKKEGSEYVGYPSICGGGENSVILHYQTSRRKIAAGDLILLDMGAEYHGYSADVTRTLPVNGKFSPEQKAIYDLVLQAQDSGIANCIPGNLFMAPHNAATRVIARGLVKLGIIKSEDGVRKYFMHGTSHYLGLDVHDAGTRGKLKPNSVITVEPGIYIAEGSDCDKKWWNIGVRIEDDILITETGWENLSAKAPRSTADIEKKMAETSPIFK
jgi:Xaa-Pro aminopeptidase